MPRGCGNLIARLAGNRLYQRSRLRRPGHELRTLTMPSTEQFLAGDIYTGNIAEVND